MVERTRTLWKNITQYDNGISLTTPTFTKITLDLGLKVAGTAVCYGIGTLVGEIADQIPYLNQWIPQAVNHVSGINVEGNLHGLVALLGGLYGFANSGTKVSEDNPSKLEKIELSPASIKLRN